MTGQDVRALRLRNQRLTGPPLETAVEVVRRLGAVQSQDYGGAKWGVAQRCRGLLDAGFDALFAAGAILRTHVMRPTWHFLVPDDIRWMLELTAPRVHAANAYYYRRLELDTATLRRSREVIAGALGGGGQLTRAELAGVLQRAGMAAGGMRLAYIVMHAELDAIICSGARRGKQFTYALLDERAPTARSLPREEALAELARRYFGSHGPALVQDYAWWSGLTMADAQAGIEMARPSLEREAIGGKAFWFAAGSAPEEETPAVHLLPNYDEYLIGHRNHEVTLDPSLFPDRASMESALGGHILVVDGWVVGGWWRSLDRDRVTVEVRPLVPLDGTRADDLARAIDRYGSFLGLRAEAVVH